MGIKIILYVLNSLTTNINTDIDKNFNITQTQKLKHIKIALYSFHQFKIPIVLKDKICKKKNQQYIKIM